MHEDSAAVIRPLREGEAHLLEDFLYEAIYVPEGVSTRPPRSIIDDDPKCRAHFEGFGTLPDDRALAPKIGRASCRERV